MEWWRYDHSAKENSNSNSCGVDFMYRAPYEDAWGTLHDPTTFWDELLKYYRHGELLLVSEGTREMALPARAGAQRLIRQAKRRHQRNLSRAYVLEADYLDWADRRKQYQRRKRRKITVSKFASSQVCKPCQLPSSAAQMH